MIMLKRLIAISVILLSVLACGQSDEEFDARVEAKVSEMLANIPTVTPIPTATPSTFKMTGLEAVGLVQQFESTRTVGEYPLEPDLSDNYFRLLFIAVPKETEGAMEGEGDFYKKYYVPADNQINSFVVSRKK